ncbi:hypothetical protein LCGC14_0714020, partial [marine sediment metagenome]
QVYLKEKKENNRQKPEIPKNESKIEKIGTQNLISMQSKNQTI